MLAMNYVPLQLLVVFDMYLGVNVFIELDLEDDSPGAI